MKEKIIESVNVNIGLHIEEVLQKNKILEFIKNKDIYYETENFPDFQCFSISANCPGPTDGYELVKELEEKFPGITVETESFPN